MKRFHNIFARSLRLPLREQSTLLKRLALYLHSGISLLEALELVAYDPGTQARSKILSQLQSSIRDGNSFSAALAQFPTSFTHSVVGVVASGEVSGTLPQSLDRLSKRIANSRDERNAVLHALAYPLLLLVAATCIIGFLVIAVFPRITPLLTSMNVSLPLVTRILMELNTISLSVVLACVGVLATSICIGSALAAHPRWSIHLRSLQYRVPIIGNALRNRAIAHTCESLSIMLSSGMYLSLALEYAARECSYPSLSALCVHAQQQSLEGIPLSRSLALGDVIPSASLALLATGERTGRLPQSLHTLCELHTNDANARLALISRLAEPLLMTVVACAVGLVAYAILAPLYGITSQISDL